MGITRFLEVFARGNRHYLAYYKLAREDTSQKIKHFPVATKHASSLLLHNPSWLVSSRAEQQKIRAGK